MNGQFQIQYSEEIRSQGRGVSPAGRKALAIATTWMVIGQTISMCTVNPLSLENYVCEESPVFPHLSEEIETLTSAFENDFQTKSKLLRRLEALKSSLHEGWDGESGLPIEEQSYLNTKLAIERTPVRLLRRWRLFPDTNGTLTLQAKGVDVAGISIGNREFSYMAYVSPGQQFSGKEPFSEESFLSALSQINRILGYDR